MPRASLPTSALGWIVAFVTSMLGFFVGFYFLVFIERLGL